MIDEAQAVTLTASSLISYEVSRAPFTEVSVYRVVITAEDINGLRAPGGLECAQRPAHVFAGDAAIRGNPLRYANFESYLRSSLYVGHFDECIQRR